MWTKKQQKAVEFSFRAHKGQKRKGTKVPYVSHPMVVGLVLAKGGADENQIIAGILHDIIEDTEFTKDKIKLKFGEDVANLVEEVSETDRDLPYKERKERAAAKLFVVSERAAEIKAADLISNMTDLVTDLDRDPEKAFNIFHTDKNKKIKQMERVVNILNLRLKKQDLSNSLNKIIKEIRKYED